MSQDAASFFELIRREGLIVLALAALVWQVYWLTTTTVDMDHAWREELRAYRELDMEQHAARLEAYTEMVGTWTKLDERVSRMKRVLIDQEHACRAVFGKTESFETLKNLVEDSDGSSD
jgi:hypothetical protein